jgi:hypothetical protein
MSLTRDELAEEVAFRIADTSNVFTTQILRRLNWAVLQLATSKEFYIKDLVANWADSFTVGTNYFNPRSITRMYVPLSVRHDTQEYQIERLGIRQWAQVDHSMTGEPTHYCWLDNTTQGWKWWPTPSVDGDFTVVYRSLPPPMTTSSSMTGLLAGQAATSQPDYLDEVVVIGAVLRMFRDLNELDKARIVASEYNSVFRRLASVYADEFVMSPDTVQVL